MSSALSVFKKQHLDPRRIRLSQVLSMLEHLPTLNRALDTGISGISILLNLSLLYLIVYHSKFQGRIYQRLFLMTCVVDLLLSMSVLIAQPVSYFALHCTLSEKYLCFLRAYMAKDKADKGNLQGPSVANSIFAFQPIRKKFGRSPFSTGRKTARQWFRTAVPCSLLTWYVDWHGSQNDAMSC